MGLSDKEKAVRQQYTETGSFLFKSIFEGQRTHSLTSIKALNYDKLIHLFPHDVKR